MPFLSTPKGSNSAFSARDSPPLSATRSAYPDPNTAGSMFEQILIRFRGGPPLTSESDDLTSEAATSSSTSEGHRGKDTIQLPISRSMAFKLSPSPSLGRSSSPSESLESDSSASVPDNYSSSHGFITTSPSKTAGRGQQVITPRNSTGSLDAQKPDMAKIKASAKSALKATRPPLRQARAVTGAVTETAKNGATTINIGYASAPDVPTIQSKKRKAAEISSSQQPSNTPEDIADAIRVRQPKHHQRVVSAENQPSTNKSTSDKRVTRLQESKQNDDEEKPDEKRLTRAQKLRKGEDTGDEPVKITVQRSSSLSKRKGEPVEGRPMKKPAPLRKPRSAEKVKLEDDGGLKPPAEPRKKNRSKSANNRKKIDRGLDGQEVEGEQKKARKPHPLIRHNPDHENFKWWYEEEWLEPGYVDPKRPFDLDTTIWFVDHDDKDEIEGDSPKKPKGKGRPVADKPAISMKENKPIKKEGPRQLRSSARRGGEADVADATEDISSIEPEKPVLVPQVSAKSETKKPDPKPIVRPVSEPVPYEYPDWVKNGTKPTYDPLGDSRYERYHFGMYNTEKHTHNNEFTKEGRMFKNGQELLVELRGPQWIEALGLEEPADGEEMRKLQIKKERLIEELEAAGRRYPIYKEERNQLKAGVYDPSYAHYLEKHPEDKFF